VEETRGVPNETPGVPLGTPSVSSKTESSVDAAGAQESRGKQAENDERPEVALSALSVNPRVHCFRTRIE
jgi:hypothetical protein